MSAYLLGKLFGGTLLLIIGIIFLFKGKKHLKNENKKVKPVICFFLGFLLIGYQSYNIPVLLYSTSEIPGSEAWISDTEAEKLLIKGQDYFSYHKYSDALIVWEKLISIPATKNEKVVQFQSIAEANIGFIYANGLGVKVNYIKAEKYWLESSKKGYMEAKYHLCYTYGSKKILGKGILEASIYCQSAYEY